MKYAVNFNANGSSLGPTTAGVYICTVRKKRDLNLFEYLIMGYGTYGSGTLAWFITPDQGTTQIPMTDLTDTAITMTANKQFRGNVPAASGMTGPAGGTTVANPNSISTNNVLQIYATFSGGSSTTNVNAVVYDNND